MFGGASELVLQYHSITIHIENAGGSDIVPIVTCLRCCLSTLLVYLILPPFTLLDE
jgi:hypothetical protein